MIFKGKGAIQYKLSDKLTSGGEAEIFDISGNPDLVAKIYKPGKASPNKERKLVRMIDFPPDISVLKQIAWPKDVLYNAGRQFVGFVMPKMNINEDLNVIYEYGSTAKYPHMLWENRLIIAENLCVVLNCVHEAGHTCGDLNPRNISVDPKTGFIVFLDTDSYHIQDGTNTYRCDVGIPEYLPAEVQLKMRGGGLASAQLPTFSKNTDNFALAIHIFQLLMNGVHPFACAIIPSQVSVTAPQPSDNIIKGAFPFMMDIPGVKIPVFAPKITILPQEMQDLFKRAFIDGHSKPDIRPDSVQWHTALKKLRIDDLKTCGNIPYHQYYKQLQACPWCDVNNAFSQSVQRKPTLTQTRIIQPNYAPPPTPVAAVPIRTYPASPVAAAQTTTNSSVYTPLSTPSAAAQIRPYPASPAAAAQTTINAPFPRPNKITILIGALAPIALVLFLVFGGVDANKTVKRQEAEKIAAERAMETAAASKLEREKAEADSEQKRMDDAAAAKRASVEAKAAAKRASVEAKSAAARQRIDSDVLSVFAAEEISVSVNDAAVELNQPSMMVNGIILTPIDAIFELIKAETRWNKDTKTVTIIYGDNRVALQIENSDMSVLKAGASRPQVVTLAAPPALDNGVMILPIEAVFQAFQALGLSFEWNPTKGVVYIRTPEYIEQTKKEAKESAAAEARLREETARKEAEERAADEARARKEAEEKDAAVRIKFGIEMAFVRGSTFVMGCTWDPETFCKGQGKPTRTVTLNNYYIGKHEVTQRQWKAVMGNKNNPSRFKGDDLPVENVNWDEVQEFINRLNETTGANYRLPTEEEWEYAAHGGSQSRNAYSGSNGSGYVAWFASNSGGTTHPVGTKDQNRFGIYDMTGNVEEWVSNQTIRGGSWNSSFDEMYVWIRRTTPDTSASTLGFRLARSH